MEALLELLSKSVANHVSEEANNVGQWRLGQLVAKLEGLPPEMFVKFLDGKSPGRFMSYRGYYDHLGLSKSDTPKTVNQFLLEAKECVGKTYDGYKGGDFTMSNGTLIFIAEYGEGGGDRLIGVSADVEGNQVLLVTAPYRE